MEFIVYTSASCPLCDAAVAVLEKFRADYAYTILTVDIRSDESYFEEYRYDIPVVVLNGEEVFRHRVSEGNLLELLKNHRGS